MWLVVLTRLFIVCTYVQVNDFYSLKLGEIQRRVSFCHAQPETKKGRLDTEINHTLPNEIALLAHFSKSNYRALFAVLARYDSQVLSLQRQRQPVLQNQLYRLVSSKLFYRPTDLLELMSSLNKLHKAMRSVHVSLPLVFIQKRRRVENHNRRC